MYDTALDLLGRDGLHLTHDLPCTRCGHAPHTYLACDEGCDCRPSPMPGLVG